MRTFIFASPFTRYRDRRSSSSRGGSRPDGPDRAEHRGTAWRNHRRRRRRHRKRVYCTNTIGGPRMKSLFLTLALAVTATAATNYEVRTIALPGGSERGIAMDYLAFDPSTKSLWVPAGNTGAVDVLDTATGTIRRITGLPTKEIQTGERKRIVGPSSASAGNNVVYVGNRADSTVCAYDSRSLQLVRCGQLDAMPDAVVFVPPANEVWTTTPRDQSIRVLDANTLQEKTKITFEGAPEGYAVDAKHHLFFTNLE